MDLIRHPIVFLHLPKTAGQTIHNALAAAVGRCARLADPRAHCRPDPGATQFPPGYALYSGHLDWDGIGALPDGSLHLHRAARPAANGSPRSTSTCGARRSGCTPEAQPECPRTLGRAHALHWSADDYFFGGDDAVAGISCATTMTISIASTSRLRRVRGGARSGPCRAPTRSPGPAMAWPLLDGVFRTDDLRALEASLAERYGFASAPDRPVRQRRRRAGRAALAAASRTPSRQTPRARRIEAFAERDADLLSRRAGPGLGRVSHAADPAPRAAASASPGSAARAPRQAHRAVRHSPPGIRDITPDAQQARRHGSAGSTTASRDRAGAPSPA